MTFEALSMRTFAVTGFLLVVVLASCSRNDSAARLLSAERQAREQHGNGLVATVDVLNVGNASEKLIKKMIKDADGVFEWFGLDGRIVLVQDICNPYFLLIQGPSPYAGTLEFCAEKECKSLATKGGETLEDLFDDIEKLANSMSIKVVKVATTRSLIISSSVELTCSNSSGTFLCISRPFFGQSVDADFDEETLAKIGGCLARGADDAVELIIVGATSVCERSAVAGYEIDGAKERSDGLVNRIFIPKSSLTRNTPATLLAHELGHVFLAKGDTAHCTKSKFLMYGPATGKVINDNEFGDMITESGPNASPNLLKGNIDSVSGRMSVEEPCVQGSRNLTYVDRWGAHIPRQFSGHLYLGDGMTIRFDELSELPSPSSTVDFSLTISRLRASIYWAEAWDRFKTVKSKESFEASATLANLASGANGCSGLTALKYLELCITPESCDMARMVDRARFFCRNLPPLTAGRLPRFYYLEPYLRLGFSALGDEEDGGFYGGGAKCC